MRIVRFVLLQFGLGLVILSALVAAFVFTTLLMTGVFGLLGHLVFDLG